MSTSLAKQIASLSSARFIDYGIQFVTPVVLARVLEPSVYGQYLLLWLVVNSALIFTIMQVPQSLFYFLPRSDSREEKAGHVATTLLWLCLTGLIAAIVVNPWWPMLPRRFLLSGTSAWVAPVFVFLFTVSQLLDNLPSADQRNHWQAIATIALSVVRAGLLAGMAWMFRSIDAVFIGLVTFAVIKVLVLVGYLRSHVPPPQWARCPALARQQLQYALPFGVGAALFMLCTQSYQWIAASMFTASQYATFVIGVYVGPFFTLVREPINAAVIPRMSALHATGDNTKVVELFRTTNTHTAFILFPLLVWFFVFSYDIVDTIFSPTYHEAGAVMRVFIASFLTQTFEGNSLFRVLQGGRYSIWLSLLSLVPALLVSYFGGVVFGLWGVALGALAVTYLGEVLKLRFVAERLGITIAEVVDWRSWWRLLSAVIGAGMVADISIVILGPWLRMPIIKAVAGGVILTVTYLMTVAVVQRSLLAPYLATIWPKHAAD